MKNDTKKDAGQHDFGAHAIDFGNGEHSSFPTGEGTKHRPDAEACYSEHAGFNDGTPSAHSMNISAKHNGGEKPSKAPTGM